MQIRLAPQAQRDIYLISHYYQGISPALGDGIVDELELALGNLSILPGIGSRRYSHILGDGSLRVWQMNRFPFLLLYRVSGQSLDVLRMVHERRDFSGDGLAEVFP